MDTKPQSSSLSQGDEEDYIDMEVRSSSFCKFIKNSPPQSREFEFQMFSSAYCDRDSSPSPADELFYKGKLLPLQLPPRLQMVKKILENSASPCSKTTISSFTAPPTISSTPLESCSVSPTESCRVSCELNPDEYFFHWSTEMLSSSCSFISGCTHPQPKKCWSKTLRLIKQSSITQKLRTSRQYFKSLFTKSACSLDESFPATANAAAEGTAGSGSRIKDFLSNSKYIKVGKQRAFEETENSTNTSHRRSFSGAIKRHCSPKCISALSSSFSSSPSTASSCSTSMWTFSAKSSGFYELNLLNRSNNYADSETENAIEGAIAHCKKSQQQYFAKTVEIDCGSCLSQDRRNHHPVWIPSLTASQSNQKVVGCGEHGNPELCSI